MAHPVNRRQKPAWQKVRRPPAAKFPLPQSPNKEVPAVGR